MEIATYKLLTRTFLHFVQIVRSFSKASNLFPLLSFSCYPGFSKNIHNLQNAFFGLRYWMPLCPILWFIRCRTFRSSQQFILNEWVNEWIMKGAHEQSRSNWRRLKEAWGGLKWTYQWKSRVNIFTYFPTFKMMTSFNQVFLWSRNFSMSTYNRVEGLCHILKFHFCWVTNLEGLEREQDFLLTFITDQAPPFYTTVKVSFSLLIGVNTLTFILFLSIFKEKHKENSAL